jgi:hypothetical protein
LLKRRRLRGRLVLRLRLLGLGLRRVSRKLRLLRRRLLEALLLLSCKSWEARLLCLQLSGIAGGLGSKGRRLRLLRSLTEGPE